MKKTSRFITGVLLIFRCVSETCITGTETQHVHGTQHVQLRRPRIENNPLRSKGSNALRRTEVTSRKLATAVGKKR